MTAKEFNRLPLSAKTGIVIDYGKLVNERKEEEDKFTIQTYSIKTAQVDTIRFIEVKFIDTIQDVAQIKMLKRNDIIIGRS